MPQILIICLKLILASFLGVVIGFERKTFGKPAGSRTYAMVALGSALFTIISLEGFVNVANFDPTRIASQIVVGIGFIGAGLIIFHKQHIEGLTTAAALWATSAVGMAIGIGWYIIATVAAILIWIVVFVLFLNSYLRSGWVILISIAVIAITILLYFLPRRRK